MSAADSTLRVWADMVKLSHSVFALPFALVAAFLAARHLDGYRWPHADQIFLIIVCMVGARSAAMTFNRIVDAAIDARNPRTANRPLPAGKLSATKAWIMWSLSAVLFATGCLGFAFLYNNPWPILLSGPVLIFLCGYSFAKRFTRWSHFWLGVGLALAPAAAWIAIAPHSLGPSVLVLMGVVVCWVGGFDIIYACQDIDADQREGLYSLPSRMGPAAALWIARGSHLLAIVGLVYLGRLENLGSAFAVGVAAAALLLIIENSMVRPGDYRRVNMAFFTLNGLVSLVLAGATITDLAMYG